MTDEEWLGVVKECSTENIPFLASMPEEEKTKLLEKSELRRVRKGNYLFHEGDSVDAIYIILKGKLKLTRFDADGREQIVGIFAKNDTVWEGMLIEDSCFPYSGVSMVNTFVSIIYRKDFVKVLSDFHLALNIIALLSRKLHDANERNLLLSTKDPKARLAAFLLYREKRDHEETIDLRLEDIAASLSMRPETASRKIKELSDEGLIKRVGKSRIQILNFEGLEDVTS